MAQTNRNSGKTWTKQDISKFQELVKGNTPTRVIGIKLGRTPNAIYSKAQELKISLKPVNQPLYNRRKSR